MLSLALAAALAGQYPTPQAPQYGAPIQYGAPPVTYSAPVTYAAPQVLMLGAGQVLQPNPFGLMLGRLGQRLEKHAWPRVQPVVAQAQSPVQQTKIYLQMSQPVMQQAVYTVAQPTYAAPPQTYGAPQPPLKAPPAQYGSPQAPRYGAQQQGQPQAPQLGSQKPSESVPPVPPR